MLEKKDQDFVMSEIKIKMRTSVENIVAGDYGVQKAAEGESVEVPRWVAEELVDLNLAEGSEEPFEVEISRALSREKMMGPLQLSVIPQDFYVRMQRRVASLERAAEEGKARKEDFARVKIASYDLVGMRLNKLLSLSSSSTTASALTDKATPEEVAFFTTSQSLSKEWKAALLGAGK